ncbi:MAG: hypothetical protein GYA55_06175 [SAR324 cluster bacterium]|uniref:PsbP C-terminal domain-containing protein n=1 Tax=SAR324 cluster bacterium TaxID=2024889 RepID=A0A7X9FRX0_9DELT|nr:hypothetical protein [SAR324 cluster bacterium]
MTLRNALVLFFLGLGLSSVENCYFSPILEAIAEERVLHDSFTLELPQPFEWVKVPQASVAAAMRHRLANFPTFNILILPSRAKEAQSPQDAAQEILKSYREMGLTNSKIELVGERWLGAHRAYYTKLQYLLNNEQLRSIVYTVTLRDKDLILTYVDHASNLEKDAGFLEDILKGFNILEAPPPETESTERSFSLFWLVPALAVVLLLGISVAFLILRN